MPNARTTQTIKVALAISCLTAALLTPSEVRAAAGGVQNCTVGSTCTIGEFLYDDDSVPLTGATCTLTSKYPDGTAHLTSQSMTGQSDGWYAYEFTAPATTGLYRATVSCTASGDTISIDRSFQVSAASSTDPSSIASAVWNYSGRTVTSFGSLIADIWASATRTLTGTGLSSGQLATQDDVVSVRNKIDNLAEDGELAQIKEITSETRLLLEQVVNKPIIQNILEESSPDLTQKIKDTKAVASQIYVNSQYLTSQSATLGASWNSRSGKELLNNVIELLTILGEEGDSTSSDTIFGQVNWTRDSWNWEEADTLYNQLVSLSRTLVVLKEGLADYRKDAALYAQAKALVKGFVALEKTIGTSSDISPKRTLFVKIKTTEALSLRLDEKTEEVNKVLGAFAKSKDIKGTLSKTRDLRNQVIALNKLPGIAGTLSRIDPSDTISIKNALLGLRGILTSNKKLLALGANKTLVNTWLEIGSIIFKTVATNPSNLITQDVEVKYYLPAEIKKEDIIESDAGLTVEYDAEKNQLYVAGTFKLSPGQTRTFSVETKDIWEYSQAGLDSIRKQAEDLSKPLEKTSYFAQGVTLRSDINVLLDQMEEIQGSAVTPEEKIKAYRECKILMQSVDTKIAGMKELVTLAGAAGNLFGFVGGSQAIAVWGLLIIIIAGFVFMSIYMKTITNKEKIKDENNKKGKANIVHGKLFPAKLVAIMLISSVASAGVTGIVVGRVVSKNYEEQISILGAKTETEPALPLPSPTPLNDEENDIEGGVGGLYIVTVLETFTGPLRVREAPNGPEIAKVSPGDKLLFVDENEGWYQVEIETGELGWISKEYSSKE